MSWASRAIAELTEGRSVTIRPRGNSMVPLVRSGDEVLLEPVDPESLRKGDVVLVRVAGRDLLHLVSAVEGDRVQISNNRGRVNGWTSRSNVRGRMIRGGDLSA